MQLEKEAQTHLSRRCTLEGSLVRLHLILRVGKEEKKGKK